MRRLFLYIFLLYFFNNKLLSEELILLDGVAVLRIGSSGLTPIYYSEEWFLNPFGQTKNLADIVIQKIWLSYGSEHGITLRSDGSSNEYAEQYLDALLEKKGVSRNKINDMAMELGYSLDDVKRELNNQFLVSQSIETFLAASGSLNISHEEICSYYDAFPLYEDSVYVIESGILLMHNSLKIDMTSSDCLSRIIWSEKPYSVLKKDLNENFFGIDDCSVGGLIYHEYNPKTKEIVCYRLVEKKEKKKLALNQMYEDITKELQMIKYDEAYKSITKQFLNSKNIIYDDQNIKNDCLKLIVIAK